MGATIAWLRSRLLPDGPTIDVNCCFLQRDVSEDSVESEPRRRRRFVSARTFRPRSKNHP